MIRGESRERSGYIIINKKKRIIRENGSGQQVCNEKIKANRICNKQKVRELEEKWKVNRCFMGITTTRGGDRRRRRRTCRAARTRRTCRRRLN